MAATRVGLIGTDDYLQRCAGRHAPCGDDLDAEVAPSARRARGRRSSDERPRRPLVRAGATTGTAGAGVTDTVVSSATREVVIGFDRPFVIIGERINPTGRKMLAAEMAAGDFSRVRPTPRAGRGRRAHARRQRRHPARRRAGDPRRAVQLVQSITDVPLSIDSSIVAALEAGLAVYQGKPLVNSVTGEEERLEQVLPLVAKYGAAVVAISNDETGISEDPDVRFAVAQRRSCTRAADHGIPASDVVVDPLVMPIGAIGHGRAAGVRAGAAPRATSCKVNTTCGASNCQLRPAEPRRHQRRLPDHGDRAGLTSAITNPLHAEVRKAVMAADVMMGHDPDCARWIARFRERRRRPTATGARRARRREGRHRRATGAARRERRREPRSRSSSSRRPASAGGSPSARRCSTRRGRSASTSTRSAAAAGSAGAARCWWPRASSPSTASRSRADHLSPFSETEERYASRQRPRAGPPAVVPGAGRAATSSSTCRRTARSTARSCARRPTRRDIELDPVVRLHYVEVRGARHATTRRGDLRRLLARRSSASGSSRASSATSPVLQQLQPALRKGDWKVTVAVHDASRSSRLAGLPRRGLRRGRRRRLDDDRRRTSAISRPARSLASRGRDEPADPLRRGPDEPRLVRDDEPGRCDAQLTAAVREALDELAGGARARAPASIAADVLELTRRRQPDHASPACSASTRANWAARRSRSPSTGRRPARPPTLGIALHPSARVYVAALHRRPRRRRRRRRDPRRAPASSATTCTCSSTSAPTPRSCSATGTACSPARARPGPRSKARRSAAASAPRRARSSACASIATTLEPRFKVIGQDLWSDEAGFDRGDAASPASAARGSSR